MSTTNNSRVAVITGGSEGIGWCIARILHSLGNIVVITGRRVERLTDRVNELDSFSSGRCLAIEIDHNQVGSSDIVIKRVLDTFGKIEILVNNVGGSSPNWALQYSDLGTFKSDLDFNLLPPVTMTFAASTSMKEQRFGRIVNIGSIAGRNKGVVSGPGYSAAKAALQAFSRSSAIELAPFNVTVNLVAPGLIETERVMSRYGLLDLELRKKHLDSIPLGRLGKPEEVAAAVCFLASDEASFITGAIIDVNGGSLFT